MKTTIRSATQQDFEQVFELMKEFSVYQRTPEKVVNTIEQMKAESNLFQCLVAADENEHITAYSCYFFAYYSWSGKALYLDDLYVSASCRGQGIGAALFNAVIHLSKKENCKKMRWQVSKWNDTAINFYKKMGAAVDDIELNCDLVF